MSLNELDEKSRVTIILGNFVNKPWWNFYWLWSSENVFDWLKFKARSRETFFSWNFCLLWGYNLRLTLVSISCLKFDFSLNQRNTNLHTPKETKKKWNKSKEIFIFSCLRCWCRRSCLFKYKIKNYL